MQKEPITGEGPKCVLSPEAGHWKKGAPARCSASAQPFGKTVDNPFVLKGTIEKGRISGNG
mgnify:FL=1